MKTNIACLAGVLSLAVLAHADIAGFNGGSGWTANSNSYAQTAGLPSFSSNSVQLTKADTQWTADSVWFDQKQSLGSFTASFTERVTYTTASSYSPADGIAFVFQDLGTNALGGRLFYGSDLGYYGIQPSAAVELNVYGGSGTNFYWDGNTGNSTGPAYLSTGSLNLASGDPISVKIVYDSMAHTLVESLTDSKASISFSKIYTGVDLASHIGSSSAFVGFTGATGAGSSNQIISDFTFVSSAPELLLLGSGILGLGGVIRRKLSI